MKPFLCRHCGKQKSPHSERVQYKKGFCTNRCMRIFSISGKLDFFETKAWLGLRYEALKRLGRVCSYCGSTQGTMHVDHIKPRSKFPELELEFENLQVLCRACNYGKSNIDFTDWRPKLCEAKTR